MSFLQQWRGCLLIAGGRMGVLGEAEVWPRCGSQNLHKELKPLSTAGAVREESFVSEHKAELWAWKLERLDCWMRGIENQ